MTGGDITQATLQTTLDKLGFDKAVNELSFAEKRLLIIISLTQQLEESAGDWGRTLESPANQLRILNEQWTRLGRAVGNLFMPILAQILPYLNAILMVLTEIINSISTLLGFNLEDYDYFGSSVGSAWDFDDALQSAGKSAKKLKQGLRSFDKLNVITTPKDSSSGAGTGINPKLMEAFNKAFDDYQKKLDDVSMKATKIRDSIMEWLGFTKEIDPITGKVSFKYQGIKTTLKNMWESFQKLNPLVKSFVGLVSIFLTGKLVKGISSVVKAIGSGGLASSFNLLGNMIKGAGLDPKHPFQGIMIGADVWREQANAMNKFQNALVGAGGVVLGLGLVSDAMEDVNEKGITLGNSLEAIGGGISAITGGAMFGASVGGGVGALVGGAVGGLLALIDAMVNYETQGEKVRDITHQNYEEHLKYNEEMRKQKYLIEDELNRALTLTTYHENLLTELQNITDANGKVNKGYEARANFIINTLNEAYGTEMEIIDGQIQGYQKQIKAVKDLIETKKANIILNANEKAYALAIENETTQWKRAQDSLAQFNKLSDERNKLQNKMNEYTSKSTTLQRLLFEYIDKEGKKYYGTTAYVALKRDIEAYGDAIKDQAKVYVQDQKLYEEYIRDKVNYENLQTAIITEDRAKIEEAIKKYTEVVKTENGIVNLSDDERLNHAKETAEQTIRILKESGVEITDEMRNTIYSSYNELKNGLNNIVTETNNFNPLFVQSWKSLGDSSTNAFMQEFTKLPNELTQRTVLAKLWDAGYKMSNELQKSIETYNPTFKFNADLTNAYKALNNFTVNLGLAKFKIDVTPEGKVSFKKLANGGMPPVGQLFVANEKGPELVGHIGGQSFVANQNQMMDLLDKKIGNAQVSKQPQIFNLYLDANHKLGSYTLEQIQDIARTNGGEIMIGG